MVNAHGLRVPRSKVAPLDLMRDQLVTELFQEALKQSAALASFKGRAMRELKTFVELSGEEYGAHVGGDKGNLTLFSYDGRIKVVRQMHDRIQFDERLRVAEQLVKDCIRAWSGDANDNTRALVEHAFQVDKQGKISITRILGLRSLNIDDERWKQAMAAIGDSIQVVESKAYVRFYVRVGETNEYRAVSLDMASIQEAP